MKIIARIPYVWTGYDDDILKFFYQELTFGKFH